MIKNSFAKGPEGWCSYDYHASIVAGGANIFILATWASESGVNNRGYIWVDHTRWSADTPEKPLSILPLLFYRNWINADPVDLRGCEVSVYLRGDQLRLDGATCYFWVNAPAGAPGRAGITPPNRSPSQKAPGLRRHSALCSTTTRRAGIAVGPPTRPIPCR